MNDRLAVNEMFTSISGEVGVIPQGELTTVIRLQGCNLRCGYCDAKDSQVQFRAKMKILNVSEFIRNKMFPVQFRSNIKILTVSEFIRNKMFPVLITGGEPLLQKEGVIKLLQLLPKHWAVQIETNGTVDIKNVPERACIVMDYKLDNPPTQNNLQALKNSDYLKFVVSSNEELNRVIFLMGQLQNCKATLAISATDVTLYPEIIEIVKESGLRILVNVQIHKFIGVQ